MTTALITGGTSGIGAAFARALAARGHDLVLVARHEERLATIATELSRRHGVAVEVFPADLADRAQVAKVAERVADPGRPIDLLVNNAGFSIRAKLTDADLSPHDEALDVMVRTVLVLSGVAGRVMRERGSGAIVNVASTAGSLTMGAYSAVKAWVRTYTEGLAVELTGTGVQVTALLPGWVRTEFHQRAGVKTSNIPGFLWLDADVLVEHCLRDVAGGKVLSMPSKRYVVLVGMLDRLPSSAVRAISRRIVASRQH